MKSMTPTTPPTWARLPPRPPRPTAAEIERRPALAGDWMELDWTYELLEGLRELREEDERRHRAKIVGALKTRAWDLAVARCAPGHA
jgi:hypothetical protein